MQQAFKADFEENFARNVKLKHSSVSDFFPTNDLSITFLNYCGNRVMFHVLISVDNFEKKTCSSQESCVHDVSCYKSCS